MPERHPVVQFFDALRRQWWIVAGVVIVAVAVGALTAKEAETRYTGTAVVRINPLLMGKPGYPMPDAMIVEARGPRVRSLVASETGLPESALAAVNAYTTGAPQDRLLVTFSSEDRAKAETVAKALATAAVARSRELAAGEVDKAQKLVDLNVDILRKAKETPATASALHSLREAQMLKDQTVYAYEVSLITYQSALDLALSAYTYDGSASVAADAASRTKRDDIVGSLFAGLVIGVALAALREFVIRRPWERGA